MNDEYSKDLCTAHKVELDRRFKELKADMKEVDKLIREHEINDTRVYTEFQHLKAEMGNMEVRHKSSVDSAIALSLVEGKIKDEALEATNSELLKQLDRIWIEIRSIKIQQSTHAEMMTKWKHTSTVLMKILIGLCAVATGLWTVFKFIYPLITKGVTP